MTGEPDLVALLYRADWTTLSLTAEVHGSDERVLSMATFIQTHRADSGPPFPPFDRMRPNITRLELAPGKRYRKDSEDGFLTEGSDGERAWVRVEHPPPGAPDVMQFNGGPESPFPSLLCPSWLLAGYDLQIGEQVTACGRDGIRLTAMTRHRVARREKPSIFAPFAGLPVARFEHVDAIVDAELGILLRCEQRNGDQAATLTEFRSFTPDPVIDPARFSAPPGAVFGEPHGQHTMSFGPFGPFGMPFSGTAWQVAKNAAGLAAGGIGVGLRYSPFGPFGPFGRHPSSAGPDDAEATMPRDDPAPGDAADEAPISDDLLHLLYRGGTGAPELTATLHQWLDPASLLAAVPDSARKAGFGGVGYLVDTLSDVARDRPVTDHMVSDIRIGGWDRYRIDRISQTPRPREQPDPSLQDPVTVACDGQRRWQVYDDRVTAGPAGQPPDEVTDLIDGSWLLRCELSGGAEVSAGGRRAFRVRVPRQMYASALTLFRFPAVALVDAETGRLLRLTSYGRGKPVARHELRDVAFGHGGDFGFEPPPGLRVVEEDSDSGRPEGPPPEVEFNPVGMAAKAAADAVKRRVDGKVTAARGFLDSLLGGKPPGRPGGTV
ncbi:MAG TPA: hypothetical protein VF482_17015 [Trebonia sp.]